MNYLMNMKTRKNMALNGAFRAKSDANRLYLPRTKREWLIG